MAQSYKPQQRQVTCAVLTDAGWITCDFHVLQNGTFLEQLEKVDEFYKVTDASLVGIDTTVGFLALQRDTLSVIVPQSEPVEMLAAPKPDVDAQPVYVLFEGGVIEGQMEWRSNIRLSDFVTKQKGFILLHHCRIQLGHVLKEEKTDVLDARACLVNVNRIVGISETSPA